MQYDGNSVTECIGNMCLANVLDMSRNYFQEMKGTGHHVMSARRTMEGKSVNRRGSSVRSLVVEEVSSVVYRVDESKSLSIS